MAENVSTPTPPATYPIVQYDITEARVAELREKYEGLKIKGPTDKGGLALVRVGRLECKGIRVAIEKRRKQYNSGALDFTRTVNSKAKEATAPVLILETSLKAEEDRIKAEIAEIKAAKIREAEERLQSRVNLLQRFGKQVSLVNPKAMSDDEFQAAYDKAKAEHEAEQARLAQEEQDRKNKEEAERVEREAKEEEDRKALAAVEARLAEQRAEQERIAAEQTEKEEAFRVEQDRIAKEQADKEDAIKEKEDALAAEKQTIENDKKIDAAKKEAAAQATKEAEEKAKREAEEKEEADRKAKEEAARQEALKPDKEKILVYVNELQHVPRPTTKSKEAERVLDLVEKGLKDLWQFAKEAVEQM